MDNTKQSAEYRAAQRELRNWASVIARPRNWNGSLRYGYQQAFRAVLKVEDCYGVDAATKLSDRLTELRHRANLDPSDVIAAERAALKS